MRLREETGSTRYKQGLWSVVERLLNQEAISLSSHAASLPAFLGFLHFLSAHAPLVGDFPLPEMLPSTSTLSFVWLVLLLQVSV